MCRDQREREHAVERLNWLLERRIEAALEMGRAQEREAVRLREPGAERRHKPLLEELKAAEWGAQLETALRAALQRADAGERETRYGYVLALRLLQSSLWDSADAEERAAVAHFTGYEGPNRPIRPPASGGSTEPDDEARGLKRSGYPHPWQEDAMGNCAECGEGPGFWAHHAAPEPRVPSMRTGSTIDYHPGSESRKHFDYTQAGGSTEPRCPNPNECACDDAGAPRGSLCGASGDNADLLPLPCLVCGKTLLSVGAPGFPEQPKYAVMCHTYGNYGSTAFDSITGRERLDFNVCDECLRSRIDRTRKVRAAPEPSAPAPCPVRQLMAEARDYLFDLGDAQPEWLEVRKLVKDLDVALRKPCAAVPASAPIVHRPDELDRLVRSAEGWLERKTHAHGGQHTPPNGEEITGFAFVQQLVKAFRAEYESDPCCPSCAAVREAAQAMLTELGTNVLDDQPDFVAIDGVDKAVLQPFEAALKSPCAGRAGLEWYYEAGFASRENGMVCVRRCAGCGREYPAWSVESTLKCPTCRASRAGVPRKEE